MGRREGGRKWLSCAPRGRPCSQGAMECVSMQVSRQAGSLPTADSGLSSTRKLGRCRGTLTPQPDQDWMPDPSRACQRLCPRKLPVGQIPAQRR